LHGRGEFMAADEEPSGHCSSPSHSPPLSPAAARRWHLGMSRWEYTPTFRGYNSFHGFYSGGQDYFT
jgi:hypothetical protein